MEIFCGRWLVAVVDVAVAAALFAVASKAELRFIAIKSFVLSATVGRRRYYASFGAICWAGGYHDKN